MELVVNLFLFYGFVNCCYCLLLVLDSDDELNQCGVPWDDVNGIAEVAIIKKCQDDLAAGYPSFCGFRLYFEILWDYITGQGQLDDKMISLGNQLWTSLMFPSPSTEDIVRRVYKIVLEDKVTTNDPTSNDNL